MTYQLTLSRSERKAIDWIGHRYFHGNDFYNLLEESWDYEDSMVGDFDENWEQDSDMEFSIPEPLAWRIREGFAEEEYLFSCFSDSLKLKLLQFCEKII